EGRRHGEEERSAPCARSHEDGERDKGARRCHGEVGERGHRQGRGKGAAAGKLRVIGIMRLASAPAGLNFTPYPMPYMEQIDRKKFLQSSVKAAFGTLFIGPVLLQATA